MHLTLVEPDGFDSDAIPPQFIRPSQPSFNAAVIATPLPTWSDMTLPHTSTLQIDRADIARTRWHEAPRTHLEQGQVRLQVEHFGLSANNITYATLGGAMNYWEFFPQEDPVWGCLPVWGYATVTESRCAEVVEGRRVFGFLPFATDVVMTPTRADEGGFVDGSFHRASLASPYNAYTYVVDEPAHVRDREAYEALLRPLFVTSLLIADWLGHEKYFGADNVLISSASSKTAYGTAYALTRLTEGTMPEVVGLTSSAHVESTRRLGLYDRVLAYDDVATLDPDSPTVYVDMSGSAVIRAAVHTHCSALRHDCAVGLTHWDAASGSGPLPGPEPVFFFAPTELARQASRIGRAEHARQISDALEEFVATVSDPSCPLMTVTWREGLEAASAAYLDLVAGRTDPVEATVVALEWTERR